MNIKNDLVYLLENQKFSNQSVRLYNLAQARSTRLHAFILCPISIPQPRVSRQLDYWKNEAVFVQIFYLDFETKVSILISNFGKSNLCSTFVQLSAEKL